MTRYKLPTNSKLTPEHVRDIRRRVAAGEPQAALCQEYGLHRDTVYRIVARKMWGNLPDTEEEEHNMTNVHQDFGNNDHLRSQGLGKKDLIRIYPDRAGEVRWKRQRPNGRVIADSGEGYTRAADAWDGMKMANADWENCRVVDHTKEDEG